MIDGFFFFLFQIKIIGSLIDCKIINETILVKTFFFFKHDMHVTVQKFGVTIKTRAHQEAANVTSWVALRTALKIAQQWHASISWKKKKKVQLIHLGNENFYLYKIKFSIVAHSALENVLFQKCIYNFEIISNQNVCSFQSPKLNFNFLMWLEKQQTEINPQPNLWVVVYVLPFSGVKSSIFQSSNNLFWTKFFFVFKWHTWLN